ncbi:MAG: hypothetical protein KDC87_10845 [Planctomycetes bacterium]|nr:hypothetical protein [Planctomycetota bacterium]MCB9869704.1 hypothetical protein [Planctomycetota bacterium]
MVKKSTILEKFVGRFRSGPVRVASDRTETVEPVEADEPVAESRLPVQHIPEEINPRSRRRLSPAEDLSMAINESFTELSSLMRGVQVRMEDQGTRLSKMGEDMHKLPVVAEAQLVVLRRLADQLDKQQEMQGTMVRAFGDLPEVMKGVQRSLERSAATDDRTASTLSEFKQTMARIQGTMGEMVDAAKQQAQAAGSLANGQAATVKQLETSTQGGLEALRWAQEDQANRLAKMVGEGSRWNRAVLVMLVLSFAALVAIFGAVISR